MKVFKTSAQEWYFLRIYLRNVLLKESDLSEELKNETIQLEKFAMIELLLKTLAKIVGVTSVVLLFLSFLLNSNPMLTIGTVGVLAGIGIYIWSLYYTFTLKRTFRRTKEKIHHAPRDEIIPFYFIDSTGICINVFNTEDESRKVFLHWEELSHFRIAPLSVYQHNLQLEKVNKKRKAILGGLRMEVKYAEKQVGSLPHEVSDKFDTIQAAYITAKQDDRIVCVLPLSPEWVNENSFETALVNYLPYKKSDRGTDAVI